MGPSPITDADMVKVIEDETNVRKNWIHGTEKEGWKFFADVEGIRIDELAIQNTPIHVIRATAVVCIDMDAMLRSFTEGGLAERQKVSAEIIDHEKLYQHPDRVDMYISYSAFSAPFGVSNREFLTLRDVFNLEDNSILIVSQSINMEKKPYVPDRVRATTRSARYFVPLEKENEFKV